MRGVLLAAAVLLTACVDTFAKLYSEIPQYEGRNIDALVDRIGYPESQTFIAGDVVYTWTAASTMQTVVQPIPAPPVAALPPHYLEMSSEPETMRLHFPCTLKVNTNGRGIILHISWEGKPGSCAP